jgi:hypothetical protein
MTTKKSVLSTDNCRRRVFSKQSRETPVRTWTLIPVYYVKTMTKNMTCVIANRACFNEGMSILCIIVVQQGTTKAKQNKKETSSMNPETIKCMMNEHRAPHDNENKNG